MHLLLDTHLVVWAMGSPQRLPAGLAAMLEDPRHTPLFSVASLWELVIKQALGRPDFNVQPAVLRRVLLEGAGRSWPSKRAMPWRWPSCRRCTATRLTGCCWPRPRLTGCC